MREFVYKYFRTFLIIFSILSLSSVTPFWWISLISMVFFIWNIFNEKKRFYLCITFLILTAFLNIFHFTVLIPLNEFSNKIKADLDKTGYDSTWLANSQESINVIDRAVEAYRLKYGTYPNTLSDIKEVLIFNLDLSYREKQPNGQTKGVPFYYEKVDSLRFYLAGVGKDGLFHTDDDLLPQISKEQEKTTGLVKYVTKSFSSEEIERERKVIETFRKAKKIEKLYSK